MMANKLNDTQRIILLAAAAREGSSWAVVRYGPAPIMTAARVSFPIAVDDCSGNSTICRSKP
jgi:hypothetical protein